MRRWTIILLLCTTGCSGWQPTGGVFSGADYTLDLPQGWMMTRNPKFLFISKDGPALQRVNLLISDLDDQKKGVRKSLRKGMLPQELAESILDLLRADKSLIQLSVLENEPALIGGKEGFRLVYTNRSDQVRYKTIYYGLLIGETFYRISYSAPVRYYFDRDAAVFEQIVKSFSLGEKKSGDAAASK